MLHVITQMTHNVFILSAPPTVQIKPYAPCTGLTFMAEEKYLTLDCQVVSGNPIPSSFRWFNSSDLVGQEQRYTINRVRRNSGGLYRCVAHNSVAPDGEDSVNVTVHCKRNHLNNCKNWAICSVIND